MAVRNSTSDPVATPRVAWGGRSIRLGLAVIAAAATVACAPGEAPTPSPVQSSAAASKLIDITKTHPEWLTNNHVAGPVTYQMSPPVGGDHNGRWQNCAGDIYPAPIANEHAVHSLEHGAVWITYRPDLAKAQVEALAARVRERSFMMLSPYPGLTTAISVQAWGYQLTTDSAADPAIDTFIRDHRQKGPEPGAPCTGGVTRTGTQPVNQ